MDDDPIPLAENVVPDWEERFWQIANEPVWLQSQEELEELADTIPLNQIQTVLDQLANDESPAGLILAKRLIWRWAQASPVMASQWVAALADDNFGHEMFQELADAWAEKDLDAALDWIQQQPDGGNKTAAQLALASDAAQRNQAVTAIFLVEGLAPGPERDDLLNYAARQWAATDRSNAVVWIEQVSDPALRERMLENVTIDWTAQDPYDAAGFASTMLTPGSGQDNIILKIVQFWTVSSPEDAAAWVEGIPEGQLRNAAINDLADILGKESSSTGVNATQQE